MVSALVKQKKRASYAGMERRFHDEQPAQKRDLISERPLTP